MLEKFRGTLYGVLVGDCFGALFQESSILSKGNRLVLRNFLDNLEKGTANAGLRKSYTDDTALTLAVARTINSCKQIDQKELAVNFVNEFYKNVYRGFDGTSMEIFAKLKHTNFEDVLFPAKEAVNSDSGSNTCAMYIAPIALVCSKDKTLNINDQVRKATALTHLHEMAVNGAILQANVINTLVTLDKLNVDEFLDQILDAMQSNNQEFYEDFKVFYDDFRLKANTPSNDGPSFVQQLQGVKKLLSITNPSDERVVNVLGHSSQALYSVPTAIYCFLRGVKYQSDVNPFRDAIEYSIGLGGHANTIASMTGALCGAYYGDAIISEKMLKQCEGFDEIKAVSEDLYKI